MSPPRGQRRAPAGYTTKPWPCCGEDGWARPKDGTICKDCRALIEEGKAARAQAAAIRKSGATEVYRWTEQQHGWPRFYDSRYNYTSRFKGGEPVDLLEKAFMALVAAVSTPAPPDTPTLSPRTREGRRWDGKPEREQIPWDYVLDEKGNSYDAWSFSTLVLMPPAVRDALSRIHAAIKDAMADTYNEGKQRGGSVLQALARGDASLTDFNAAMKPKTKKGDDNE